MKAMILAAGLGTRLRPLTNNTPKALLLVDGRPLISYSLKLLQAHGIKDVVINLHHLGELIEKELGDGSKFGMRIHYSWEPKILGTGGGIKKASSFFGDEAFLVLNSDVLIDLDLKDLIQTHRRKKSAATMVLRPLEAGETFTAVWTNKAGRLIGIGDDIEEKKKQTSKACMYTGIQILEPRLLEAIPDGREACLIREGYRPAILRGDKICGYLYDGYWNDLGTLDRYRQAEADLKSERIKLSYLV